MNHSLEEKRALDCADRYAMPILPIYDNIPMILELETTQYLTAETDINNVHRIHDSVATVLGHRYQVASTLPLLVLSMIACRSNQNSGISCEFSAECESTSVALRG
jgi:hypothetical protein